MADDKLHSTYQGLISRILKGEGKTPVKTRLEAFDNKVVIEPLSTLIRKVAVDASKVTDGDIEAVKKSGLDEDQIFELIICAAVGQSARQYETGLNALNEAITDQG